MKRFYDSFLLTFFSVYGIKNETSKLKKIYSNSSDNKRFIFIFAVISLFSFAVFHIQFFYLKYN